MPLLNSAARMVAKPVPRIVSPEAHAIIDYMTVGTFFLSALWFWRKSKRAAVASLISGGAELAVSLLTNYPGGAMKIIPFRKHRDIDFGLGAMTATLPEFLAFQDEPEKKFFLAQGAMITIVSELTSVPGKSAHAERKHAA
jgi:hypothetical protein